MWVSLDLWSLRSDARRNAHEQLNMSMLANHHLQLDEQHLHAGSHAAPTYRVPYMSVLGSSEWDSAARNGDTTPHGDVGGTTASWLKPTEGLFKEVLADYWVSK